MIVKQIRLSVQDKEKLSRLKGKTGIQNWNILCRWALCCSLREKSIPLDLPQGEESNVEISWFTFGGENYKVYEALIKARCIRDGFLSPSEPGNRLSVQYKLYQVPGRPFKTDTEG